MKKKKICWITSDSFLDVDKDIVPSLSNRFEIYWFIVITLNNSLYQYDINKLKIYATQNNIRLKIIKQKFKYKNPQVIPIYFNLFKKLKQIKPNIIYTNIFGMPFYYPIMYLFNFQNVIYATHDVIEHVEIKYRRLIKLYKKFVFRKFKNFHLFSKTQLEIFSQKYPKKNTFYAPLSLKDFGVSNKTTENDKIIFLFFGTIRENKGLEFLIKATKEVYEQYPNKFQVKICGYTPNWNVYENLIGDYNRAFHLDIRKIPNREIPDLFSTAHYLVLPYKDVTQSGPLFIAYNYSSPVIATDLPGFSENIESERNGFLFNAGDAKSLANKMLELINNHEDKYHVIKDNLIEYVANNMSLNAISNKYVDFFNKILK